LPEFIQSAEFLQQKYWAISKHRALSQYNNPRADKDDVALIVAYNQDEMLGYIGALPDYLMIPNNKTKIAWISTWWVKPKERHTSLAKQLLDAIIAAYEKRVLVSGFTPQEEQIYRNHFDLEPLRPLKGYTYQFKSCKHQKIKQRNLSGLIQNAFLRIVDGVTNALWFKQSKIKKYAKHSSRLIEVDDVSDLNDFFEPFMLRNIFKRNVNTLNWINENPWVLNEPFDAEQKKKYAFDSAAKNFYCKHYVLYDEEQKVESYCMVVFNNGQLRVPYLFAKGGTIGEITDFLWHLAAKENAFELVFFHKFLGDYLESKKYPAFKKFESYRKLYAGNFISWYFSEESDVTIADGDGDSAFG